MSTNRIFIDQERLRCSRGREDQLGTRIGLSFRYSMTHTMGIVLKRTSRSFAVHDPGEGNTSADEHGKSINPAGACGKCDQDQCLLR